MVNRQRQEGLTEISPSTLNRTAFPANAKKRAHHWSPSQSPNSIHSLSPSAKQTLQRPSFSLKRSSGVLNLSSRGSSTLSATVTDTPTTARVIKPQYATKNEESPSISRVIKTNYSKNEEMLKSFNELSFDGGEEMDIDSDSEPNSGLSYSRSTPSMLKMSKKMFPLHKHTLSSVITSTRKPIELLKGTHGSALNTSETNVTISSSSTTKTANSTGSTDSRYTSRNYSPPLSSASAIGSKKSHNIFGSIPLRSSSSSSSNTSTSPFFKRDEPTFKKTRNGNNLTSSTPRKPSLEGEQKSGDTVKPLNLSRCLNRSSVSNRRISSAPISTNGHYVTPFNNNLSNEKLPSSASLSSVKPLLSVFSSSGLVSKSDKLFRDHQRDKCKPVPETPMKKGLRDIIGSAKAPTSTPHNNTFNSSLGGGPSINNTTFNTTVDNGSYLKNNWNDLSKFDMEVDDEPSSANARIENESFNDLLSDLQRQPKFTSSSFNDDIITENESPTIKKSMRYTNGLSQSNDTDNGSYWQRAGSQQSLVSDIFTKPSKILILTHDNKTNESLGPKTPVEAFKMPADNLNSQVPTLQWSSSVMTDVGNTSDIQKMEIDSHLYEKFGNCTLFGNGEFSLVYEIEFKGVKYAVKKTKEQIFGPKKRKRLWEEVELLKEVSILNDENNKDNNNNEGNEYVITLISAWEFNNQLYIMTEFCENGTLDGFLLKQNGEGDRSKLDEWRIWKILIELCLGLKWIHQHNIIHLDLKPANIFITFDGTLKIGDFGVGIKVPISIENKDFDREGDREYIAPEIISRHEYTTKADIFSVGLIMLETAANVVLPENGSPWRKLRSGDLSDAGRLSSGDLAKRAKNINVGSTNSSLTNNTNTTATLSSSKEESFIENIDAISMMEPWTPVWFYDGSGALDKIVNWMMSPNPKSRPSANELLNTWECQLVETRRQSGATIYEGDFGPSLSKEELENEILLLKQRDLRRVGVL